MPATELDYITIQGFKSISSLDKCSLGPINVVIGANGSGKSNFIEVFSFLHAIREGYLQDYVAKAGGAEKILHFGSKITSSIYIHISFGKEENQYSISLSPTDADELYPNKEDVYFWNKIGFDGPLKKPLHFRESGREAGISEPYISGIGHWVRAYLERWRLYHFHDTSRNSPMKKTAFIHDNIYLRPDAANLAAFLYFLRERHIDSYHLIRGAVQRVAPFLDDFVLEPSRLRPDQILLQWRHKNSDQYFDASSLSDGTLRFIALATLFLQPKGLIPSVILVDEPELGLHPAAITLLASLIKSASQKAQVIVSTQSSLLLDYFTPEDILVADRVDGGTQLRRLDSASLASWLNEYSLGQLWEKNELGGRPARE